MLNFNSNGLLVPDQNIQSNIVELEKVFVTGIQSAKRHELFSKYISYSTSLKALCNDAWFTQWIDGSFVTKKTEPRDIDLVTFIDFSIIDALDEHLTDFKYPASQNIFGIDAYIVRFYPEGHKFHRLYLSDWAYWMDRFSKTRRNRIGNKLQKGFLEINM
ncbi:MAG: DUF6932 family protein [Sphingobacteriales bacterium]